MLRRLLVVGLLVLPAGAWAQADPDCDNTQQLREVADVGSAIEGAVVQTTPNAPTRIFVEGTPEQIGRAMGERYAAQIRGMVPLFQQLSGAEKASASVERIVATLDEDALAELRGIAAGAGVPLEDIHLLNTFYNLTVDKFLCRQLSAWGPSTLDGKLIHARNLDWPDYPGQPMQKNQVILNVKPDDGIEHLVLTFPGISSAMTGTNKEGITIAFNQLYGPPPSELREPVFFTIRRILSRAESLDEALAILREARPMGNGSIMISDAKIPRAVVVEMMNGEIAVREADQPGLISNANHATTEAGLKSVAAQARSAFEPVSRVAQETSKQLAPEHVQAVMGHADVLLRINITSVVFMPSDNRMLLSAGTVPAAHGEFVEYTLFPE